MKNRGIKELVDELSVVTSEKENKTKELSRVKAKCRRLDEKVLLLCFNLCHTSLFAASHFARHTKLNPNRKVENLTQNINQNLP